jgi:hypothetical protein
VVAALGAALGLAGSGQAAEPPPLPPAPLKLAPLELPSANQALANAIAENLRANTKIKNYLVDLDVRGGTVEITGTVANQAQREEVLRIVQGVPGVERVVDHLTVEGAASDLIRTQVTTPPGKLPEPLPGTGPMLTPPDEHKGERKGEGEERKNGAPGEPVPLFRAPPPNMALINPPKLPPYAWPTYAPYNNFSRVAVPLAYPYNAWPFIGPIYPFPKVPLGWRSVKLEWDDGYWWFGRVGNKYDWWKLRFW